MHRVIIHRVGVSGIRLFPLYDKLIEQYSKDKIVMTTDNNDAIKSFSDKVHKVIDFRPFFKDDERYSLAKQYNPPDAELIKKMAPFFHNIIEIEGRNRKNEGYLSRVNYYYDFLGYWNGLIDELGIDLFLCESLPHEFHGLLLYYLCKAKGIPTIVMCESIIGYSYFTDNEFAETNTLKSEKINKNAENLLNDDFKAVLNKYMDIFQDVTPYYNTKDANRKAIKRIHSQLPALWIRCAAKCLLCFQILLRTSNTKLIRNLYKYTKYIDYLNTRKEAMKFYFKNTSKCDFNTKYVYFPLHYQPEMSTLPMAGFYENQILIIRMLSKCLPDGYIIYVKEHTGQFQDIFSFPGNRDINYYKELLSIDKVKLISTDVDTYKLINNCVCVATATGTAGFEALFRNKQVIMFGGRFFQYAPGVYRIKTMEDCKEAVNNILCTYSNYKTDRKRVANFLLKMQQISFYRGIMDGEKIQAYKLYENDKNNYSYELLIEFMKKNNIWQDI